MQLAVLPALLLSLLAQDPLRPDAGKGVVDGKAAVSFWPVADEESEEFLAPFGFEAHLVPLSELDRELVHPCGIWFVPPGGGYKVWVEGEDRLSPPTIVHYKPSPFAGRGFVAVFPVEPAGRVGIPAEKGLPANTSLRLLHLGAKIPQRAFDRRTAAVEAARKGLLMPAGRVLMGLFARDSGEALALSRPLEVVPGQVTRAWPQAPSAGSDLLVVLERPRFAAPEQPDAVELSVEGVDGAPRAPDVFVSAGDRVYGVWYGLKGRTARLLASSAALFLAPRDVPLRPGKVETVRAELGLLPGIDVTLDLPDALKADRITLAVRAAAGNPEPLRRVVLPRDAEAHRFEALPAAPLDVVLEAPPWIAHRTVDLSSGEDGSVEFRPQAIEVRGTVYRGAKPARAEVAFRTGGEDGWLRVQTDERGAYGAVLWGPGGYLIQVDLAATPGPPFVEVEPIEESRTLDFHIPGSSYSVRVLDEETGRGIAGAAVSAGNHYVDPRLGERDAGQKATTGEEGVAELQPLRPGELMVAARADGYLPSETLTETVPEAEVERELTLRLRPVGPTKALRLLLPGGAPAAGAELRAQRGLGDDSALWQGRGDAEGEVQVPDLAEGAFLLVRHPQAGSVVREWRGGVEMVQWTLPPAAPPLAVAAVRPSGEAAAYVPLALWLDGVRLTGRSLAFLAWSLHAGAGQDGSWLGRNLPPTPLRLLAWTAAEQEAALDGLFDARALAVAAPWPAVVRLETVD